MHLFEKLKKLLRIFKIWIGTEKASVAEKVSNDYISEKINC